MTEDNDTSIISALDFVRSGRLTNTQSYCNANMMHQSPKLSALLKCPTADRQTQKQKQQHRQTMENAARVALCLTLSFVEFCSQYSRNLHGKGHKDDGDNNYVGACPPLPLIELRDFSIHAKKRDITSTSEKNGDCNLPAGDFSSSNGKDDQVIWNDKLHLEEANIIASQLIKSSTKALQKRKLEQWTILRISTSLPLGAAGTKSRSTQDVPKEDQLIQNIHDLTPIRVLENLPSTVHRNLQNLSPMQTLGKLLYIVFSQGQQPPLSFFLTSQTSEELVDISSQETEVVSVDDNNDDFDLRSPKSHRLSRTTVFTSLVETKRFPVSVCRLLASMMMGKDDTSNAASDNMHHFASFKDVIQDLEHMIGKPQAFLHDEDIHQPCNYFHGKMTKPVFGENCFGRKEEMRELVGISTNMQKDEQFERHLEAVFVSGVAGAGKSRLVHSFEASLSNDSVWIVIKAKFERGMEYASRGTLSQMFDGIISYLVKLKESGGESNMIFIQRASNGILDALGGIRGVSALVDFLPSLPSLFGGLFNIRTASGNKSAQTAGCMNELLINSLTKILKVILESGRFILIVADDLQWADELSISLIGELLNNVAGSGQMSHHCMFIVLYREEEVRDDHPLSIQLSYLQMSRDVSTTEIKLGSLSRNDVADMIMTQLRLSRHLVIDLAVAVHKKTSGHALFVVELLNSLLRDSIITYSTQELRYVWDWDRIDVLQTADGVAGLILSNFSSFPPASQQALQVLSTFGTQTDSNLLQILENYQDGFNSSLDFLIEKGILDSAGGICIFSHDLIQQEIYQSMPLPRRQQLHLELGKLLGNIYQYGSSYDKTGVLFAGSNMISSIISLACDQINSAGPKSIRHSDKREACKFAKWNLDAGSEHSQQSNFRASLHYYSKGITFLGDDDCVSAKNVDLCLDLFEGAALSSYALGDAERAIKYADKITEKVVPEKSNVSGAVILKSLAMLSKHEECIQKGISMLHRLGFDLPSSPTKESIIDAMASTDMMVSQYSVDQIANRREMATNDPAHSVVKIFDALYQSCLSVKSPFVPLIACYTIKYTLENGVCQESTTAFATFGQFKIFIAGDYSSAKRYADIVRAMTKRHELEVTGHFLLNIGIDPFFDTPRELSEKFLKYHHNMMAIGEAHLAVSALGNSWRCQIYGGENLSLIYQSIGDRTKMITKYSKLAGKFAILDNVLVEELIGIPSSSRSHDLNDIKDIQAEAESNKETRLLFRVHLYIIMISYWTGDFATAEELSNIGAKLNPGWPSLQLIYFTFFRGLVLFQCYSEKGGAERLQCGQETINQMEIWAENSMAIFENKLLLLKAEYAALVADPGAETMYKKSIRAARDHGLIHELGQAYELLGDFYTVHGRKTDSLRCIENAYRCYSQWGATSIAKKLLDDRDIDIQSLLITEDSIKHPREWE